MASPPTSLRWVIAGSLFGVGTFAAMVVAFFRAPSRLAAALSLDSEFGLKERVTTSLTLAPEQQGTAVGQALLADVNQRVDGLDVGARFPVRMTWNAAVLPICVALLAVVALFYQPSQSKATANIPDDRTQPPPNASEISQKMRELQKKVPERKEVVKEKSEELKQLESELEKIANRPHETKEQIRERVKEMTALEDTMKGREKEMAEKARALQQQLSRLDKMGNKDGEGPAKDLEKALSEGKLDKAKEELERLSKRLQANQMTKQEKELLKKQLKDLQNKLERLAKQKDKEEALRQANLDPETLKRELNQLKKDSEKMKGLQDLANQLAKCEKSLKEGDMDQAAQSLDKAGAMAKQMQMDEEDLQDLRDQLTRLTDAKDSC
jgi:hypothetical protein